MADLRYALRALLRSPGFTIVAVLSLALGIGANTAIFSLVDAVMLRALPVPEPGELVRVTLGGPGDAQFTNPIWEELRDVDLFDGSFAYSATEFDLAAGGQARPVQGTWVAGGYFSTLGVRPALGRLITVADDSRGCPATAVLSHGFWQSEFGGDPGVLHRPVALNGHSFDVVGVAAAGFTGFEVGRASQLFVPLCASALLDPPSGVLDHRSTWFLRVGARLPDGLSIEQARARIAAVSAGIFAETVPAEFNAEMQESYRRNALDVVPAATGYSDFRNGYDTAMLAMMGVVAIVLLIACANVANLLLARGASRRREIAIRRAIGAGRSRLVRQLLTESLLLSTLAAIVGLLVAVWANGFLLRFLSSAGDGLWLDLSLNPRVLLFTAVVAVATAMLFGLAPAWRATGVSPQLAMKGSDRPDGSARSRFLLGKSLVVGQVALCLLLLVAAGLLLGSFRHLATLDPGFRSEGVLIVSADLRNAGYSEEQLPLVKAEILDRLRDAPQVRSASASEIVPLSGAGWNGMIEVDGYVPPSERDGLVYYNAVSEDFFATLGTEILGGREFTAADDMGSPFVAIVNEAFVDKYFGGRNPLGQRVGVGLAGPEVNAAVTVVGVVSDAKYVSLREETREVIYLPLRQAGWSAPNLAIELRAEGDAAALIPLVSGVLEGVHPRISVRYRTLAAQVGESLSAERLLATLSSLFGALALLLAMIGLYGTISYGVARRRRELGIRMALGADGPDVVRMVLREAGAMVGIGAVVGSAAALLGSRLIGSFLFGLSPTDPATFAGAILTLALVALVAGGLPAWRAARVDPIGALRAE